MNPAPVYAFNPGPVTGDGNWTWLIGGDVPTLVDAGTGDPRHIAAVEKALAGAGLAQVLVTHAHGDHASGAPALAQRFPHARFRKMPWHERDSTWPIRWDALGDGDVLEAGDTSLVVVHTPGHAPDHLCFWHAETRTLFGGDLAIKDGTVWIPAALHGDLAAYLASLERVIALAPARLFPAHGPVIDDPVRLLRNYLQHRREREYQIIDALRSGAATPEAIVLRVYQGLDESLRPLAKESVTAHLIKLRGEGRVRCREQDWHLI